MSLQICETFSSILGESTLAGLPAFFIRLTGCNLRCRYCDTTYAYEGGVEMTASELLAAAGSHPARRVLVTGGEPLLQAGTLPLLSSLADASLTVMLETNGSLPIRDVDPRVRRILDLKCPGSGMESHNLWENLEQLRAGDEVKFVIRDQGDFVWAAAIIKRHRLAGRAPLLISPVFGEIPPREAAAWILGSGLDLHLNLQLHKYIWGPETRGV
jgi:7-carboxy-7-deazaguanine synthase